MLMIAEGLLAERFEALKRFTIRDIEPEAQEIICQAIEGGQTGIGRATGDKPLVQLFENHSDSECCENTIKNEVAEWCIG